MDKKIVTYSLLAHINNTGTLSNNYEDIFIPLVKRGIAKMCNEGQFEGDDISDIKKHVDSLYGLDMPSAVLKKLLLKIEREINKDGTEYVKFFSDKSFIIKNYTFNEYEDVIQQKENELNTLQRVFEEFAKSEGVNFSEESKNIFDFVEKNKFSLGKYINRKYAQEASDNSIFARFINFIKLIPDLYSRIQDVYIGSIISNYLEYEPKDIKQEVELVLDTNFVISLLDLNTSDSTSNCLKLLELGKKLGYKFTVLNITIQEIEMLLNNRIDYFDSAFLSRLVDPEDIYNACHRRNLSKTDLEQIKNNLEKDLEGFGILVLSNTEKYQRIAKQGTEIERLQRLRNTPFAALHDATCTAYVQEKRGKPIYDFNKVNCWFVNNSSSRNSNLSTNGQQPVMIKAEDLLNMLWLTSPMIKKSISAKEITDIGITRLVSACLNDALPKASVIKELDDNIRKYSKHKIPDEDVVRISRSIAQKTLISIEQLNDLAKRDDKEFVIRLQEVAQTQRLKEEEQINMVNRLLNDLKSKHAKVDSEKENVEKEKKQIEEVIDLNAQMATQIDELKKQNLLLQNQQIQTKREEFRRKALVKWRRPTWITLISSIATAFLFLLVLLGVNNFDWKLFVENYKELNENPFIGLVLKIIYPVFTGIVLTVLVLKYFNESNIAKYEERIKYPQELDLNKTE